jgi:choloylglycine hydrolase
VSDTAGRRWFVATLTATWLCAVQPVPAEACTAFVLSGMDGPVVARNLDWPIDDGYLVVNRRGVDKTASDSGVGTPVSWTSRHGSISFNQLGHGRPLGGMNEAGLVVEELSYWPARYPAEDDLPVLDELEWIQYLLDTAGSVAEALDRIGSVRISKLLFGLHYLIADRSGDVAVVEFLDARLEVRRGDRLPVSVVANDTYANSVRYLQHHVGFGGARTVGDGPESPERFVRAAGRVQAYAAGKNEADPVGYAFQTLAAVAQDDTQWRLVYDPEASAVHFETRRQPTRRTLRLGELDLGREAEPLALDLNGEAGLRPWTPQLRAALVAGVVAQLEDEAELDAAALARLREAAPREGLEYEGRRHPLYPEVSAACPELPSPLTTPEGHELVVVRLHDGTYGIVDVSLADRERQLHVDAADFPALARTGLHDPEALARTRSITGRPVEEITALARPGGLSQDGFLAADEDILSVLGGDDVLVRAMGLTHPELARPLFHVWNLIQADLDLDRWSMREHRWGNVAAMKYNGRWVLLDAYDTKGGQRSPFDDGLDGGFWIVIRRPLDAKEEAFLHEHYAHLDPGRWDPLHGTLTRLYTGEMEPYYVMWYGFYEGHTAWRVDPVGIASVFGLRSLEQLEAAFPRRLEAVVREHHRSNGAQDLQEVDR